MRLSGTPSAHYRFSIDTCVTDWEEFLMEILENSLVSRCITVSPLLLTNKKRIVFFPNLKSALLALEIGNETLVADIHTHSSKIDNKCYCFVAGSMARGTEKTHKSGGLFGGSWAAPLTYPTAGGPAFLLYTPIPDEEELPARTLSTLALAIPTENTVKIAIVSRSSVPCKDTTDGNPDVITIVWKSAKGDTGKVNFTVRCVGFNDSTFDTDSLATAARTKMRTISYEWIQP